MSAHQKSTYAQGHHPCVTAAHALRSAEVEGAFVLPHLSPKSCILDVGCGPGSISASFAKYVPEGTVTGIDLTEEVLSQARSYLSKLSPTPPNVTFELGNIVDGLKYPSDTFDVVFTSQVLIHIPEPVKAMREMKRVCKPGGFIACRESDLPFHWHPYLPGLQLWDKYLYNLTIVKTDRQHPMSAPHELGHRAGCLLPAWAREAGCDPEKMVKGAATTVYATMEERRRFSEGLSGRIENAGMGGKFRGLGASEEEVGAMVRDLKAWAEEVDGWFGILQVQVICWV
ncbi:methyltransferase type 11 [Lindgomyces ingoldianus]|uniref:Methyltransferase type 11 n=1 Tax=Lindgomyces ingoldianus TaxID=673940 RepID=A0ACB6QA22_9PLEO|nr:methyltransferase type 11 [Lindgomyces ingoldianus]KAF2462967.1 methyltransferase type 11 [Lindgomyces ingoldianus]